MSDNTSSKSAPVPLQKGYTPATAAPTSVQNGYQPSQGKLGTPPTTGSVVAKPADSPKK